MYLVVLGAVFLAMKFGGFSPVFEWPWHWVLSPFAGAVIWWTYADWSGWTARENARREQLRLRKRIERIRQAMHSAFGRHRR